MGRKIRSTRRGIAAVEFAFVVPLLMALLLGVWEVGRMADVQMILENAAGVGGRQASAGVSTNTQVRQAVTNYLRSAGLPIQNVTVTVSNLTAPGTDAAQAAQMDALQVTVTIPFRDVRWCVAGFVTNNSTILTAAATFRSARVDPYPTNIQPPPGY